MVDSFFVVWDKKCYKAETVRIFLILLLFYAIMSRHIKGSNEYL